LRIGWLYKPLLPKPKPLLVFTYPETAQEKPQKGTIVAVGPGKYADVSGTLIPMTTKIGDAILYGKYAGTEINIDGKEYLIMRESDIYAVLIISELVKD
jgi:chaperonin GroES